DDDVAPRSESWPLTERNAAQQHDNADQDRQRTDLAIEASCQSLMQHVPWIQAEAGTDLHRRRDAIQDQADVQLAKPASPQPGRSGHAEPGADSGSGVNGGGHLSSITGHCRPDTGPHGSKWPKIVSLELLNRAT